MWPVAATLAWPGLAGGPALQRRKTHLDESLDLAPLGDLLCTHALCDLPRVAVDAGDNGMRVRARLGPLVGALEDDGFAAGKATR